MNLIQNDRSEEFFLLAGDMFHKVRKSWWILFAGTLIIALPLYLILTFLFSQVLISSLGKFDVINAPVYKSPVEIVDKKIFSYGNGTYSGFFRLKNVNLEWGVPEQAYKAYFKTAASNIMTVPGVAYILPSSEKVVVLPRFSAPNAPTELDIDLETSKFIRKQEVPNLNLEVQRRDFTFNNDQPIVNAVVVNRSAFTIKQVDLTVVLYNSANQVVGSNYTNINDVKPFETRSFQFVWYGRINSVARVEIIPETNSFDRGLLILSGENSSFDNDQ